MLVNSNGFRRHLKNERLCGEGERMCIIFSIDAVIYALLCAVKESDY